MSRFFIDRPIFAIVIAVLMMLFGALAILRMPVEQYPNIAPPSIQVSTSYYGASAATVESTVTQVVEQNMNGIDHLLYMSSTSDDFGNGVITLSFEPGTNPDIAQVQVQNKLQLAVPQLPTPVQQAGIRVTKTSASYLIVPAFVSTDGSMNKFDIANYVVSHIQDPVSRVNGVGNFNVFGTQYAMRVWLDPHKLNNYGLTPIDVSNALLAQNVQIASGQLGGTPATDSAQFSATITEATLLRTPEAFGNILLKVMTDGSQVRVRDVANISRGSETYFVDSRFNGQAASGMAIQLATGANALQTSAAVKAQIAQLEPFFPPGLKTVYPYETAPYVIASMTEVVITLLEGIALVCVVMFLFLQKFRTTLIPVVTVPVVLLGTFGIMSASGFTINTLSMFGLVLAIGLLVDDAIVVVENVERIMEEEGLSPIEATRKAMSQISGALVGVATVLSAVFVPIAFSSGSVGAIYRQFSMAIVTAMLLSVFVALSLTPALCAILLKPGTGKETERKGFFGWFNRWFDAGRDKYVGGVRRVIARFGRWLLVYGAIIAAVALLFMHLPTAFLPSEDQGSMYVQVQTKPGTTQAQTWTALEAVSQYLLKNESAIVDMVYEINGFNFAGRGQNQGLLFVHFRDFNVRKSPDLKVQALTGRISQHFASYKDALIVPINPPPIRALGTASGFDFELKNLGGQSHDALMQARNQLLDLARKDPTLALVRPNGLEDNPMFKIDIDREKASALGVSLTDIDQTFSISWASKFINFFLDTDGRLKRVYMQADAPFRMTPDNLNLLYVRGTGTPTSTSTSTTATSASATSTSGLTAGSTSAARSSSVTPISNPLVMVPFSSFSTGKWDWGSPQLQRYNGVPSMEIQGQSAPGYSTGQAIQAMTQIAQKLPQGFGYEWTGISLQQVQAGSQMPLLYALSILVVFLSLAALYESWSIPLSVIMVVPIGVLGALLAATGFGMQNDVYFEVGLLTTIGLAAKNAILIVEFARELQAEGRSAIDAAIEAAHIRMRPIVMTSLAFGLGVLPLALANGAGAESENSVGIGVLGGMLAATFLATFMIPMFYVVVADKLRRKSKSAPATPVQPALESGR
jgi:hydrophobe/amphiphile efflux-1 (HAE1) family protein